PTANGPWAETSTRPSARTAVDVRASGGGGAGPGTLAIRSGPLQRDDVGAGGGASLRRAKALGERGARGEEELVALAQRGEPLGEAFDVVEVEVGPIDEDERVIEADRRRGGREDDRVGFAAGELERRGR